MSERTIKLFLWRRAQTQPPFLCYNTLAMVFTTTGLAHSLTSLGLIFCAFWFFKAFQTIGGLRSGRPLGILLSIFALGLAFNQGLFALGSLFFVKNPEAFYAIIMI